MRSVYADADTIQAYDAHMNLVLGQVEESIHHVDVTDDGQPLQPRIERRSMEMLFVRGDGVILVCSESSSATSCAFTEEKCIVGLRCCMRVPEWQANCGIDLNLVWSVRG